jgi:hypothetical protein
MVGNIHYEEHWKGWALEIVPFLGPEKATTEASAIWAQKGQILLDKYDRTGIHLKTVRQSEFSWVIKYAIKI